MRIQSTGGPEVLRLEEVPAPVAGAGQVVVKIAAVGVNFIDVYHRTGQYRVPLPFTPGQEAAGVVTAVGPGVTDVTVGDRVAYTNMLGAYAEYALVPADRVVALPDGVDAKVAAAAMLQGMTAHYLATTVYPLRSGETCLVHAAAGGAALLLCQIAHMRGARVIGTVSTTEKAALARAAGADDVILYTEQDFEVEVKRLSGGKGGQVVYDSVGRTTFDKRLNVLAPRGMLGLLCHSSGAAAPLRPTVFIPKRPQMPTS